mmetsp:Transcript_12384/g.28367  ORF Transcript_12384/g.28367 Transcript_12384/m.28367 type:complete len:299 (+) Transcript_12384:228-1124(+)
MGLPPRRSTRKRIGVPCAFRDSFDEAMAASMSSCDVTRLTPTPTTQSPSLQPNFSASGLVNLVTMRFSSRSPSDFSSPMSSPTTMATLCEAITPLWAPLLSSSPARRSKTSRTPPAMPCTASPTKSETMSTASAMPSPTVPAIPFSSRSAAVPSMPPSMPSTTALTPSPTAFTPSPKRSTASSAATAKVPSALSVTPSVSVISPMPPRAAPPTNLVASPTARPVSAMMPSSSSSSWFSRTTEAGAARSAALAHSFGFSPSSTAAWTRLCGESSAAFESRSSGTFSLKPGTSSWHVSMR